MNENPAGKSKLVTFPAGEVIFYEGDEEKILYKILSGKVGIYGKYGEQQQRQIAVLEKGQCFGEMAILEDTVRSATAVAEEETYLMCYREEQFGLFVSQNTSFLLEMLKTLSLRLRNTSGELDEMHKLLLQYTQAPTVQEISKIDLYLRRHTVYDQSGNAHFTMNL